MKRQTSFRQGQTGREAGTQSHGSDRTSDSRATEKEGARPPFGKNEREEIIMVLLCWRNRRMLPLLFSTLLACIAPANAATGPRPDVVPTSLPLGSDTVASGGTTPLKLAVANQGKGTAYSVTVTVSIVIGGAASQAARISLGTLKPGASGTIVTTLTAPAQAGSYSVVATATARRDAVSTTNSLTTTLQVIDASAVASTSTATPTVATLSTAKALSTTASSSMRASSATPSSPATTTASTSNPTTSSSIPTTSSS